MSDLIRTLLRDYFAYWALVMVLVCLAGLCVWAGWRAVIWALDALSIVNADKDFKP